MNDPINHPSHYTGHPSGVEAIEVAEWLDFCLGNVWKYLTRFKEKGGVEDLKKALWYYQRHTDGKQRFFGEAATRWIAAEPDPMVKLCAQAIYDWVRGNKMASCESVDRLLLALIEREEAKP